MNPNQVMMLWLADQRRRAEREAAEDERLNADREEREELEREALERLMKQLPAESRNRGRGRSRHTAGGAR